MKKVFCALVVLALSSCAIAEGARIGALAPIGQDEKGIIEWTESIAQTEGKSGTFKNKNEIVIFDSMDTMIMALRAGKIDRFAVGLNTAKYIAERNNNFRVIDNNHKPVLGFALALSSESSNVSLSAINKAISDMKADGTLEMLKHKNIIELGDNDPETVELPKIDGAKVMKVAVTGDLPPMDYVLPDGRPAGFNIAFLAELSKRLQINIELLSVSAGARQEAISSGRADAVFWTRSAYDQEVPLYPLDKMTGVLVSEPYFLESRAAVSLAK